MAEYEGNPQEALFAYAALQIISKINSASSSSKGNYSYSGSSSGSIDSSSGGGSAAGGGCATFVAVVGLFLFAAAIVLLIDYYPYYTLLHVIVPALIIVGVFIKRQIKDEEYEYPLSTMLVGGIKGAGIGILTLFIVAMFDMGINRYMKMGRELIVSYDDAYTICWGLIIALTIMLNGKKKK